ncbi:MAG: cation-transporting P-type ATPase [Clostridia bacterium]|nr:cation-transporting P-type ATPase [Clostridia bacterium]
MNERWYSLSIEETERKLNTNISSGLELKEAALRRRKSGAGSFYKQTYEPLMHHISKTVADITVILFSVISLISAFFGGGKSAVVSIIMLGLALVLATVLHVRSKRIFENAAELSIPRSTVIRSGRVYIIDSRDVVEGDILLLKKGDVVPCDCRLISSSSLSAFEFLGKVAGKEKRELTHKRADAIYSSNEKLVISAQENMIGASAVIFEGEARAIAVRVGRNTFTNVVLGELDPLSSRKKEMKVLDMASGIFSKYSLGILILTFPITAIAMMVFNIKGSESVGILDVILIMTACAVTSGSELLSAMLNVFPASVLRKEEKKKHGSRIKSPAAVQEMNYLDSVMILGRKAVCSDDKRIESVFCANRFYNASEAQNGNDQALNCMMDLALLGTAHFLNAGVGAYSEHISSMQGCAGTISDYASLLGIDRSKLLDKYEIVEFSSSAMSGYETTLVKNGEEYRVICLSDTPSLLEICTHIRTPDGALVLDADKKSDIIRACSQLSKKAKSVTLVASRISPCSSLSRLGAVQNQLIFEGYIVYDTPYTDGIEHKIKDMQEADISLYYIDEESAESVITAFNLGIVKSKYEIAYASSFRRANRDISENFGQYKAYLGFSISEIEKLLKLVKGDNGTLATIGSKTEHLSLMNASNISVAITDRDSKDAIESISEFPEIIRKNADMLVPKAQKAGGGLDSLLGAVLNSKNACTGLAGFFRYLIFTSVLRITLSVLPLLFGHMILSPVQIILLGTLIDIIALIGFSEKRTVTVFGVRIDDVETIFSQPLKSCAKYMISGFAVGAIILFLAAVFGSSNIASGNLLTVFALGGAALSQLCAVMVMSRFEADDVRGKRFFVIHAAFVILILLLSLISSTVGNCFDISYPGWQICAAAPLSAVIGYVIILVTDRYI